MGIQFLFLLNNIVMPQNRDLYGFLIRGLKANSGVAEGFLNI